jgi:hypothetical protein
MVERRIKAAKFPPRDLDHRQCRRVGLCHPRRQQNATTVRLFNHEVDASTVNNSPQNEDAFTGARMNLGGNPHTEVSKLSSPLREENSLKVRGPFRPMTPTEIGSGFHEPQYPVRTSSCRPNLRIIHRTVSKVMTPIDKKSTTGPNIIDHKVELPTIKACPTVFQLPECTLSQIGNSISQRTEMTAPIFCQPLIAPSY